MTMDLDAWQKRRVYLQNRLWEILGRPATAVAPRGEVRDRFEWDGLVVEQIVYNVEPGQDVDLFRAPEIRFGDWAREHGIAIERLYDTAAHFGGLSTLDLGIKPLPVDNRRCLCDHEVGSPRFTLEGWLTSVERQADVR